MATTTIKTTFQLKRGTSTRWQELNLILAAGEPGFEIDTNKLKIGDGVTPWNELNYICECDVDYNNYLFGDGFVINVVDGIQNVTLDAEYLAELLNVATQDDIAQIVSAIPTKLSQLENDAGYATETQVIELSNYDKATNVKRRYEVIPHKGAIVEYRDSEIRINTQRVEPTQQQAGSTAPANQYYLQFRAYAPEGATGYKEWQGDTRDETMYDFNHSFAGTDTYGRNYSLIWFSVASWNGSEWTLYGDRSTVDKYLGFYYTFEWYKGEELIGMDKVRLILTNDNCHNDLIADPIARYVDNKTSEIHTVLEDYATTDDVATIIDDKLKDGVSANAIIYGTF